MIRSATTWQAKAGRGQDLVALFQRAKAIHQRHGARVSAFTNATGEHAFVRQTYLMDFASFSAAAATIVATNADPDWQALWARAVGADAPGTPAGSTFVVFPDADNPAPPEPWDPQIATLRQYRVEPGRADEALTLLTELRDRTIANGAGHVRIGRPGYGPNSGGMAMIVEHESWETWGRANDAIGPEMREWVRTHFGADSPVRMLDNTVRVRVPLT